MCNFGLLFISDFLILNANVMSTFERGVARNSNNLPIF